MPLALEHHSPVNDQSREDELDEDSDDVQLIGSSISCTPGASALEKAIGVHAVDQATLERDIAFEVLKFK